MGWFLLALLFALLFFGLGFIVHVLWIVAVAAVLFWLVALFFHHV